MYKIAIAGAYSLIGRELKDVLAESPLAAADCLLLDDEGAQGQLDQVGEEITFVQPLTADSFDRVDFTFFCGSPEQTLRHWRQAVAAGSTVLDLTGALDAEPGALVRAPWLGLETTPADLCTPAILPAHPAALALSLILERLQKLTAIRFAAATILHPASEFGREAMDELHQQTINLLSFQPLPRAVFDAQTAYNLLGGLGESARVNMGTLENRIRRHYALLSAGRWPQLAVQTLSAPVFHGTTLSLALELERPVDLAAVEAALAGSHVDLVTEDGDSPSNLAATGQDDLLIRIRAERDGRNPNLASRLWIWAAADNLRMNAQNALACAMELRRLRPTGSVQ